MSIYNKEYFNEGIFSTDYDFVAKVIMDCYQPKSIIEFGCGNGSLSIALNGLGAAIDAVDGYSEPDFSNYPEISFKRVDLNNRDEINNHINGRQYDLAICTEVAEHLQPESSRYLITSMARCAPVLIFSAAVPHQEGNGHINCQSRAFWHNLFTSEGFKLQDSLREVLRTNSDLAIWYKLNLVDYIANNKKGIEQDAVIKNLIASESFASSLYYEKNNQNSINEAYLNMPFIKQYFQARNSLKKVLKRQ